jgi:L-amino acid N-acyltransferase
MPNRAKMQLITCTYEMHGKAILDILNEAIANSTALYDYYPRTLASMVMWFEAKQAGNFPVLGIVDGTDCQRQTKGQRLLGFASYGHFRAWPAYKYSIEHSVYVHKDFRGQGIGWELMQQLIIQARAQQYHTLIGGIDLANQASIALHLKLGFKHAGTIEQAGFKFGRWLDLGFYQLLLATPDCPIGGSG